MSVQGGNSTGPAPIRTYVGTGNGTDQTGVSAIDVGGGGTEKLLSATNPMPIGAPPSLPLPTGAALEAGNLATVATNTGRIPAQGQALAAGSLPVVMTAAQVATLTPPAAITNYANETGGNLATVAGAVSGAKVQSNAAQVAGTAVSVNTGNADAGTQRVVLASNQPAVNITETNLDGSIVAWAGTTAPSKGLGVLGKTNDGTPQYQPIPEGPGGRTVIVEGYAGGVNIPVVLALHQSTNVDQINGTAPDTNSGNKSAGTQRVVLATDQPAMTNAQPFNVTQVAGAAIAQGHGTAATAIRVELPTDGTGQVSVNAGQGTLTDRSGTITAGGTAQTLAASNAPRKYLFIQNNGTAPLWFNFTTTAVQSQPSIQLLAGQAMTFSGPYITTELVSVIGATTAQAFSAKEG